MPDIYVGHFKCQDPRRGMEHLGCGAEWHAAVGAGGCPNCRLKEDYHPYITWVNYPVEKPFRCEKCNLDFERK